MSFLLVVLSRVLFHVSLHEQLLPLAQLLVLALPTVASTQDLVVTYDLMCLVLDPEMPSEQVESEGVCLRPQSRNRMLQALLVHHFSLLKMLAHALIESKSHFICNKL